MITIKSKEEIDFLRKGGKRLGAILKMVAERVSPGISTRALDEFAHSLITKNSDIPSFLNYQPHGADRPYPATTCLSINEEIIHGIPNEDEKILKEGDIVGIDIGLIHEGVFLDSAITVGVGEIDESAKKLIRTTREALEAGIKAARGGGNVGDIGHAIETLVKGSGFSLADGLSGHGVGRAVHEDPYVPNRGRRGEGPLLKPGMVLAIEPMLNEGTSKIKLLKDGYTYVTADGTRSAHFEHTVVITEGAPIVVTRI